MAGDWSDEQNDAIVADYFAMLGDDIAGRLYSKAEHTEPQHFNADATFDRKGSRYQFQQ